MPIAHLHILEGRSDTEKTAAIAAVTEALVTTLDVTPAQVRVLIHELPAAHWGAAGVPIGRRA